ncbi:MAG: hypothetical protein IT210_01295 [Armatimonadetes bacterium]|nr:hypothetical protein [Armatimonadota bacterium]
MAEQIKRLWAGQMNALLVEIKDAGAAVQGAGETQWERARPQGFEER